MGLTYLSTQTASSSSSLSFTSGIDSTYDAYEFHFVNMHPATNGVHLSFQVNADGQTGFNEVITSTLFYAYNKEDDSGSGLQYYAAGDQAQGTAYQYLNTFTGNQSDASASGVLRIYSPSSTTYVKHFTGEIVNMSHVPYAGNWRAAGYINTTSAIDEIDFKMSSGNIDAGTIHMYGVS